MEILAEILFGALQFVGEILLQVVFEALAELGLQSAREVFQPKPHPALAALGYVVLGSAAGGLSLLIFPKLMIVSESGRVANLALTPLVSGVAMSVLGAWRRRRDEELVGLDVMTQ